MIDEERRAERAKLTTALVIAGAASLLLPLLGLAYLHLNDAAPQPQIPASSVFSRRGADDSGIKAISSPAPAAGRAAPPARAAKPASNSSQSQSSLSFIRGGDEYFSEEKKPGSPPPKASPKPKPKSLAQIAPKKTKKPFVMPHLVPTGNMTDFRHSGGASSKASAGPGAGATPDVNALMKKMPSGAGDVGNMLQGIPGLSNPK